MSYALLEFSVGSLLLSMLFDELLGSDYFVFLLVLELLLLSALEVLASFIGDFSFFVSSSQDVFGNVVLGVSREGLGKGSRCGYSFPLTNSVWSWVSIFFDKAINFCTLLILSGSENLFS
jgi:hypothetical protein